MTTRNMKMTDSNHVYALQDGPNALFELFRTIDVPCDAMIMFHIVGEEQCDETLSCKRTDLTWFSSSAARYVLVGPYDDEFGDVTVIDMSKVTHVDVWWDKRDECHA